MAYEAKLILFDVCCVIEIKSLQVIAFVHLANAIIFFFFFTFLASHEKLFSLETENNKVLSNDSSIGFPINITFLSFTVPFTTVYNTVEAI